MDKLQVLDAKPFLDKCVLETDLSNLSMAVSVGYRATADFMRFNVVMGSFQVGMEQRPYILRAFVDYSLMRMADANAGWYHEIKANTAKNCHHVRVFKGPLAFTAHFMGRKNFRGQARRAVNLQILSKRNGSLFAFEDQQPDISTDFGYAQILHGGNSSPELLAIGIPTRDQSRLMAITTLDIPQPSTVEAEIVREEFGMKLKQQIMENNDVQKRAG